MVLIAAIAYLGVIAGFFFWITSTAVDAPEEAIAEKETAGEVIFLYPHVEEERKAA